MWDRRRRLVAAAVVVGIVSLSRVFLGVHYGVDIVVGVLLGLGFLKAVSVVAAADDPDATGHLDPARLFAIAAGLSVLALAVVFATGLSGHTENAAAALGGCLVCFLVSHARGLATAHDNPFEIRMRPRRTAGAPTGRRADIDSPRRVEKQTIV